MRVFISSSSKIMVDNYVRDKRLSSIYRYLCMNRQDSLFLNKTYWKLTQLRCLQSTCVERKVSCPSSLSSSQTELNDTGETETQELYQSNTVHVKIQLKKECSFGEQFFIVGDDTMFGLWQPSQAIALNWSDGHIWIVELDIPIGKIIQFKFVLKGVTGTILWQPGPDRAFSTWKTEKTISVCADWENAEVLEIVEEEPSTFKNSNMETRDGSGMLTVADSLSHPVQKPVSQASKGSTVAENESTMEDKSLVETPREEGLSGNISLEEKPLAIIAENIGSSYDNPVINATTMVLHNNDVIHINEEKDNVSSKNASMGHDVREYNGKKSSKRGQYVENIRESKIYRVGEPVLIPGLTPLTTESAEASIPNNEPKGFDYYPADYSKSIDTLSRKQQTNNEQSEERKNQNMPEFDGTQKAEAATHQAERTTMIIEQVQPHHEPDEIQSKWTQNVEDIADQVEATKVFIEKEKSYHVSDEIQIDGTQEVEDLTHQAETTKLSIEQEQPHHEAEEQSHLVIEENFNSKVNKDIQWGRNTLHKLLLHLGLL